MNSHQSFESKGSSEPIVKQINPDVSVTFDRSWFDSLMTTVEHNGPWNSWPMFQLAMESEQASLVKDFDQLQCLAQLPHIEPMPHQLQTAKKVVHEMGGRAILADEVGLGKTIEAGLILKEYMVRGLAKRVLILVPASLVLQWVRELNTKFSIQATAQRKNHTWDAQVVVASIDTAKREPHRETILATDYDLIIIDEAHKLKNKKTTNYQFALQLSKKYCLLLTATPIQNDLDELFNLISLLKPGQLGGQSDFNSNFVVDKRMPKNEQLLQETLAKVMIRNTRLDGNISFTKRHVQNIILELSPDEQNLYEEVTKFVHQQAQNSDIDISSLLSLVTLQREVCSSRDAVFLTLINMFKKTEEGSPLRDMIWALVDHIKRVKSNTKSEQVLQLIKEKNEKFIIFTEYRATQEHLLHFLKEHHITAVSYSGGMNRGKKDWMMDLFKGRAQVLIATEAGGEGINLQFCHNIINYDLPWNPMRVEQRIGRVHRLGQQHDVYIYNLCTKDTIEQHILNLLHEKINMFELVIGELDTILERIEQKEGSIEQQLAKLLFNAKDESQLNDELTKLGQSFRHVPVADDEQETNNVTPTKPTRKRQKGAKV